MKSRMLKMYYVEDVYGVWAVMNRHGKGRHKKLQFWEATFPCRSLARSYCQYLNKYVDK
jgi:hypothetical protein